jgi:pimeloyl-ACP methyl ester carboxylesterase
MSDQTSPLPSEQELLQDLAQEIGRSPDQIPHMSRGSMEVASGQELSYLSWGAASPEAVFLHGGGQNAHTWDRLIFEFGLPALAIDLPGHGQSSWRDDHDYGAKQNAVAVAPVIDQLAPRAKIVVGMSLGGLTAIRLATIRPELVRSIVLVDVTPGTGLVFHRLSDRERGSVALVRGPRSYPSFARLLAAAAEASPERPMRALRRGVLHNAHPQSDGSWAWRYDVHRNGAAGDHQLWDELARLSIPITLVKGDISPYVSDPDLERFASLLPAARIAIVPGAGHSVQSHKPEVLARLILDLHRSFGQRT